MQTLIVSDIHANLAALESVLKDAEGRWNTLWCLGDLVGYGPRPNECVARIRELAEICLMGNHDSAALGLIDIDHFNDEARKAVEWTQKELDQSALAYLERLEPRKEIEQFTLAHASPRYPIWEYVLDVNVARANFADLETPYCFIGHSHIPLLFEHFEDGRVEWSLPTYVAESIGSRRMMINPGSVGQPRDNDPRAAYAILDTGAMTVEHRRVPYPIEETQEQMRKARLPSRQIERLAYGW